jgi:monoamine oxidase
MGLKLRPFVTGNQNPRAYYYIRGIRTRIVDAKNNLFGNLDLAPNEHFTAGAAVAPVIMGLHFADLIYSLTPNDVDALFMRGPATSASEIIDQQSLGDFLQARLKGPDTRELIGATTGLEVWWDKSLSMFIRDEIAKTGDGLDEIVGGTDLLPTAIAKSLPKETIQFETEVVEIEAGVPVKIHVRSATGDEWIEPDFAICTIPFPVLRRIQLNNFGLRKLGAIRNLHYASSTKVLLHCKQRFWELNEGIFGGASLSDGISRSTYYPSDNVHQRPEEPSRLMAHLTSKGAKIAGVGLKGLHTTFSLESPHAASDEISNGPGVLVASYNWGRDARRLGELDQHSRAKCVIDAVSNFHPDLRDYVDDSASMFWDDYKWTGAAFSFLRPNDMKDYYSDSIRPEGRLHFAGEHCSTEQAWMQGAAASALRTVGEIVSL